MNKIVKIGGILIVFVALAALIGSTFTFAQSETPTVPTAPDTEADTTTALPVSPMGMGYMGQERGGWMDHDLFDAALADELGITVDELNAAREVAKTAVLTQMVADGTITQAQMDAIVAGDGLRSVLESLELRTVSQAAIAETLGLTAEELETALANGERVFDLAAAAGVTMTDLQTAVQTATAAAIEQAVADGLITQEQADSFLQNQGQFGRGGRGMHGGGMGGPGMHGGMGGSRGGGFGLGGPQG